MGSHVEIVRAAEWKHLLQACRRYCLVLVVDEVLDSYTVQGTFRLSTTTVSKTWMARLGSFWEDDQYKRYCG